MEAMIGANRIVEAFAGQAAEASRSLTEQTVGLQERNVAFLRSLFEEGTRQARQQTEASLVLAQELFEQGEEQRENLQALTVKALRAYWGLVLPSAGLSPGVETAAAPEATEPVTGNVLFPIAGYARLTAAQVTEKLDGLSVEELEKVRAYEMEHKNRGGLLAELERRIEAAR